MVARKLILADVARHKVRAALTITAIAMAVSLIVAVTTGYASIESAVLHYYNLFMGSVDAQVTRANDPHGTVPASIESLLNADPDVHLAVGRLESQSYLIASDGKLLNTAPAMIAGIDGSRDPRVGSLQLLSGKWFTGRTGNDAVIDQVAQELLKTSVGQTFDLPGIDRKLTLRVVGVVHKPTILAQQIQTIYVPIETLQRFVAVPATQPATAPLEKFGQYTRINIALKPGTNPQAFATRWRARLAAIDPTLRFRLQSENRQQLDRVLDGVHVGSYLASSVSMAVAGFIIFSALAMGVAERQRTLAMLRAIGAQRALLGRLVIGEALTLSLIGALLGIPLGLILVRALAWRFSELFIAGLALSWGGILFALIASLFAAVAASLIPAWSAMRQSPLEAMSPLATPASARVPIWTVIAGLLIISIDPWLVWVVPAFLRQASAHGHARLSESAGNVLLYVHFAIGVPSLFLGYFLLSPLFVAVIDRFGASFAAAVLAVPPTLLRQQLSSGLWRCAGTAAALMTGLTVLVVLHVQANTVMSGWKLPDKFPDIFLITFKPGGLAAAEQEKLRHVPGIHDGQIMPIAVASPQFGSGPFALAGAAMVPDATMFFGVDPDIAFKLMELDFRDGNPADAQRLLKLNRHLIVTQEFRELRGIHVGDTLRLRTPRHGLVDYTVAGVVWSPGIDVIVSDFDMGRQFDQRTAFSVFGTLHDAAEDFGVTGCYIFAANLDTGTPKDKLIHQIEQAVGAWGLRAGDVRNIKEQIRLGFQRVVLLASTIALAAMALASLGVANSVMAAVRSRRWQLGVLRSIGLTRSALLRLILAEAALLGLVGAVLGLVAGFELALDAHHFGAVTIGYNPSLSIPWPIILYGALAVIAVAVLASLWPALSTARQSPLTLLQAGRSST
jgi:putative ABC transport system permease protein